MRELQPEIVIFAGPNGSGKSTVTEAFGYKGFYINADSIKASTKCTDLEAAQKAEKLREQCVEEREGFTFETVLSTRRNIDLLARAKEKGFFIRSVYVFTRNPKINVLRVAARVAEGGHDVPQEKIVSRYAKSVQLLPELIRLSDVCNIYDNSKDSPVRIFKKRKDHYFYDVADAYWRANEVSKLTGIPQQLLIAKDLNIK